MSSSQGRTPDLREQWLKQGKCPECGGRFWAGRGWVPHAPDCPERRNEEQQERERAALSRTGAPFPIDETGEEYLPRTYFRARSYWEQDVDLGGAG